MDRYHKSFSETRKEVLRNSKWFVEYIAPITCLVIAVITFAFVSIADENMLGMDIAHSQQKNYEKSHSKEIQQHFNYLMNEKDYYALYMLNYRLDRSMNTASDSNGWNSFYAIEGAYRKFREAIIMYYDDTFLDNYSRDSFINSAAAAITGWQEEINNDHYYKPCDASKEAIAEINKEAYLFLQAYCDFTEAECEKLSEMNQTEVVALLARRLVDAEY